LKSQQGEVFLCRDWTTRSEYSEAIACRIDAQVRIIVEECYTPHSALHCVVEFTKEQAAVPAIDIERAIARKRLFEENPEAHTYYKEEDDGQD
jgi:ATP-dependent Zn protease